MSPLPLVWSLDLGSRDRGRGDSRQTTLGRQRRFVSTPRTHGEVNSLVCTDELLKCTESIDH